MTADQPHCFCWTARLVSPSGETRRSRVYRDMDRRERVLSRRRARVRGWVHGKWELAFGPEPGIAAVVIDKAEGRRQ